MKTIINHINHHRNHQLSLMIHHNEPFSHSFPMVFPVKSGPQLQDGKWKPLVVMGGFATVDSNQLSVPAGMSGAPEVMVVGFEAPCYKMEMV